MRSSPCNLAAAPGRTLPVYADFADNLVGVRDLGLLADARASDLARVRTRGIADANTTRALDIAGTPRQGQDWPIRTPRTDAAGGATYVGAGGMA